MGRLPRRVAIDYRSYPDRSAIKNVNAPSPPARGHGPEGGICTSEILGSSGGVMETAKKLLGAAISSGSFIQDQPPELTKGPPTDMGRWAKTIVHPRGRVRLVREEGPVREPLRGSWWPRQAGLDR